MRIALVGWYGHQNAGDDRLEFALRALFRGHFVTAYDFDEWRWIAPMVARYDYVIFGGGTLFTEGNTGVRRSRLLLQRAGRPFAVLGLGIDRVPDEFRHHLEWTTENARLFVVRDPASREQCPNQEKVVVGPDLSWQTPYLVHQRDTTANRVAVNLAHYGKVDPERSRVLVNTASRILPKAELIAWPFSRDVETDDTVQLAHWFAQAPEVIEGGVVPGTRFAIAHRYHAMHFATQMALPFIPVVTQKKAAALLEEMGYPVPVVRNSTEAEWEASFQYLLAHEEELVDFLLAARQRYIAAAEEMAARVHQVITEPHNARRVLGRRLRALAKRAYATVQNR
jgi:polysaccharide pyruvyl transferase WcaK-like protein